MGEYTDQEIEMLARFCDASWPHESDRWTDIVREALAARQPDPVDRIICVAARLMRAAREQGAAEMRKQVIAALRALPDGTWGDERGEMSPWPDAIAAVEALKVPQ